VIERLLQLIRRDQIFFDKNFAQPARHPINSSHT
jgi:hypothetical protein